MNELTTAKSTQTMSSREIAEITGKQHMHVIRDIRAMIEAVKDDPDLVHQLKQGVTEHFDARKYTSHFDINRFAAEILITGYDVKRRAAVIKRWFDLESSARQAAPATYIEALQALIESEQAKLAAEEERNIAVATKAEIGNRREATAMATASNATQRATRLEVELDRSKQYATIKRMGLVYHGLSFNWRELKTASIDMDLPPIDVFDSNYGTVKSYHSDVWKEVYGLEVE